MPRIRDYELEELFFDGELDDAQFISFEQMLQNEAFRRSLLLQARLIDAIEINGGDDIQVD